MRLGATATCVTSWIRKKGDSGWWNYCEELIRLYLVTFQILRLCAVQLNPIFLEDNRRLFNVVLMLILKNWKQNIHQQEDWGVTCVILFQLNGYSNENDLKLGIAWLNLRDTVCNAKANCRLTSTIWCYFFRVVKPGNSATLCLQR